ncbi:GNAT family N-acetyltransferase [Paenibacillus nasutitermitis]|uniref:N-acetyltransferase n=1 Tax=Paenibacillus nasutitermitis TaxID=1652958 RepID=A0A916ZC32_9BACL|nr:GNAT family N-acetyltransferase [Paenibacillus nasutitermitis]GGD84895.1 N-acetyltransferase [Paenibacillus nasutitermitis]
MILETQRLILREFTVHDLEDIHVYASNPMVVKHMMWGPNTKEDTQDYMDRVLSMQKQEPRQEFELAAVIKDTKQLVGGCGIYRSKPSQGEIGYCFHSAFWGKGFASEAADRLLEFGFSELGLHRIFATCRPGNLGSAKVMQKIGMKYEGHIREHMWHKGSWHDSFQYSILENEHRIKA